MVIFIEYWKTIIIGTYEANCKQHKYYNWHNNNYYYPAIIFTVSLPITVEIPEYHHS